MTGPEEVAAEATREATEAGQEGETHGPPPALQHCTPVLDKAENTSALTLSMFVRRRTLHDPFQCFCDVTHAGGCGSRAYGGTQTCFGTSDTTGACAGAGHCRHVTSALNNLDPTWPFFQCLRTEK